MIKLNEAQSKQFLMLKLKYQIVYIVNESWKRAFPELDVVDVEGDESKVFVCLKDNDEFDYVWEASNEDVNKYTSIFGVNCLTPETEPLVS